MFWNNGVNIENGRGHCPISVSPPAGWSAAVAMA